MRDELTTRKQQVEHMDNNVKMIEGEVADIAEQIHREREDIMERIRTLTREIR